MKERPCLDCAAINTERQLLPRIEPQWLGRRIFVNVLVEAGYPVGQARGVPFGAEDVIEAQLMHVSFIFAVWIKKTDWVRPDVAVRIPLVLNDGRVDTCPSS